MFWDGSNLYRIYSPPGNYDPRTQYASDFGSLSYLIVSEVDKSTYQEIKDNKAGHWDYSIVPEQHGEVVVGETERLMLFHSFYKVIRSDG